MNAASLPARIAYTIVALPLGAAAGFYVVMLMLPKFVAKYPKWDTGMSGQEVFNLALSVGAWIAFTVGIYALTLPWSRHRKRRGRGWRVAVSLVIVLVASAVFADVVHRLVWDLLFALWLAHSLAYTFVRYGVVDQQARRRSSASRYY